MNHELDLSSPLEPERYELKAPPIYHFEVDRREFFKFLGAGVLIVCVLKDSQAEESVSDKPAQSVSLPKEVAAWLHIGEDGGITVFTGKVEMGQNIRTSLTQAVAEELRVPVSMIRLVMGDTDLTPFDSGTSGSRTTPAMAPQLRKAAAAARELLIDLVAQQWNVDRGAVRIVNARFVNHDTTK